MSLSHPLALTPCLPTELLSYVLQQAHPTTLIICRSRTSFLSSLVEATSLPPAQPQAPQEPDPDLNLELSHPPSPSRLEENDPGLLQPQTPPQPQPQLLPQRHPLLIPTLYQISLSRHTITAFIPTVSHLRAYLSVFSGPATHQRVATGREGSSAAAQGPLLVVYGLVELHRGTSEWSTQGLGNTCAALVEAGCRSGRRVVLVEERPGGDVEVGAGYDANGDGKREEEEDDEVVVVEEDEEDDDDDEGLGAARTRGDVRETGRKEIWREKLPILSGSVRRVGAEVEYGGRTVEVGMVLRRWFQFGRGEWEDG